MFRGNQLWKFGMSLFINNTVLKIKCHLVLCIPNGLLYYKWAYSTLNVIYYVLMFPGFFLFLSLCHLHVNNISKFIYSSPGTLSIKILYISMRFKFALNKVFDQIYWLSLKYIQQYRWSKIAAVLLQPISLHGIQCNAEFKVRLI